MIADDSQWTIYGVYVLYWCKKTYNKYRYRLYTDVIVDAPKDIAIDMFLRTMSPDVIICDELTQYADSKAVARCFGTGVNVIASIHGDNIEDIKNKEIFKDIIGNGGFTQALLLSANKKLTGERVMVDFYDL